VSAAKALIVSLSLPAPPLKTAEAVIAPMVTASSAEPVLTLVMVPESRPRVNLPVASEPSIVVSVEMLVARKLRSEPPEIVRDFKGAPARSTLLAAPEATTVIFWISAAVTVTWVVPAPKPVTPNVNELSVVEETLVSAKSTVVVPEARLSTLTVPNVSALVRLTPDLPSRL